jgi:hypothetical protein
MSRSIDFVKNSFGIYGSTTNLIFDFSLEEVYLRALTLCAISLIKFGIAV